jgi:hypothetical protein
MIVEIRVRDDRGKWVAPNATNFACAALDQMFGLGTWSWIISMLSWWCLKQAGVFASNPQEADAWIARYQALRSIK